MGMLDGKVALVTGGGSGIGRAAALTFAREGARVAVADVNTHGNEETAKLVRSAGGQAIAIKADVMKSAEVEAMVNETVRSLGGLHCAFNCAGIASNPASMTDLSEEVWDRVIAVNLKGVWLCMKYEIPHMLRAGGGSIVNASSVAGLVASAGMPAYYASKHGVIGLTRAAGVEYAARGVRVNAVCPPPLGDTPMMRVVTGDAPGWEERSVANIPLGRLGTAQEIAEAVVWLCSDRASLVTGAYLAVDGGYTAR